MEKIYLYSIIPIMITLTFSYYVVPVELTADKTFLSISTFIFSIFTGFFISRQAQRFNKVRGVVTGFDGKLSSIYRVSGHISSEIQNESGKIITAHYNKILESKKWDIHFTSKSTTISSLDSLLDKYIGNKQISSLKNQSLNLIIKSLAACQDFRKQMIALHEEKIPTQQWILIIFFAAILITSVSILPSSGELFMSILKSAFVVSVLSVLVILHRLNMLKFSEEIMGEHSANDVLKIIDGTR